MTQCMEKRGEAFPSSLKGENMRINTVISWIFLCVITVGTVACSNSKPSPCSPGTGTGNFATIKWVPSKKGGKFDRVFVSGDIGGLWMGKVTSNDTLKWKPAHRGWHQSSVRQVVYSGETLDVYALGGHAIRPQFAGQTNVSRSIKKLVEDGKDLRWEDVGTLSNATVVSHIAVGNHGEDFLVAIGPGNYPETKNDLTSGKKVTEIFTLASRDYRKLQLIVYAGGEWKIQDIYDPYKNGRFTLDSGEQFEQRLGIGSLWMDPTPAGDNWTIYFTAVIETWEMVTDKDGKTTETRFTKRSGIFKSTLSLSGTPVFTSPEALLLSKTARFSGNADIAEIEKKYPPMFQAGSKLTPVSYHPLAVTGMPQNNDVTLVSTVSAHVDFNGDGKAEIQGETIENKTRVAISASASAPVWKDEFAETADGVSWNGQFYYIQSVGNTFFAGVFHSKNTSVAEWGGLWERTPDENGDFTWRRKTYMVSFEPTFSKKYVKVLGKEKFNLQTELDKLGGPETYRRAVALGSHLQQEFDGLNTTDGEPIVFFELRVVSHKWNTDFRMLTQKTHKDVEGSGGSVYDAYPGFSWRTRTVDLKMALEKMMIHAGKESVLPEDVFYRLQVYIKTGARVGLEDIKVHWSRTNDFDTGNFQGPGSGTFFNEEYVFETIENHAGTSFDTEVSTQGGIDCHIELVSPSNMGFLKPANMNRKGHWRSANTRDIRVERFSAAQDPDGKLKILLGAHSARGLFLSSDGGDSFNPVGAWKFSDPEKDRYTTQGIDLMEINNYYRCTFNGEERLFALANDGGPFLSTDGGDTWRCLADDMQYVTPSGKICSDVYAITDRVLENGDVEIYACALNVANIKACNLLKSLDGGKTWQGGQNQGLPETGDVWSMTTIRRPEGDVIYAAVSNGPEKGIWYLPANATHWVSAGGFRDGTGVDLEDPYFVKVVGDENVLFVTVNLPGINQYTQVAVANKVSGDVQAQAGLYVMYLDSEGLPGKDHFRQVAGVRTENKNGYPQAFRQISDVDFVAVPNKEVYRIVVSTRGVSRTDIPVPNSDNFTQTLVEGGVYISENLPMNPENGSTCDFTLLRNHPDAGGVAMGPGGAVYAALGHYGRGYQFLVPDLSAGEEDVFDLIPSGQRFRDKYNELDGSAKEGFQPGIYIFYPDANGWGEDVKNRINMDHVIFRPSFLRVLDSKDGVLTLNYLYIGTRSVGGFRTLRGIEIN